MNYTRLRILELAPGGAETFHTGGDELIVLPLSGAATAEVDGERFELEGRESVFSAVSDFAYAPRDATVTVSSEAPPPARG
jgi:5-deoxy-glucuronate isomerase